ncbi:MAG: hypothetical protein Q9225_001863 [Loekoesia sp. 1 TL-2023]
MPTLQTQTSTLAVLPLLSDPLLFPNNHRNNTTTPSRHSRFFPRNSPILAFEASLSASAKAQIWTQAVSRASFGLKWGMRKNPKHLRVNSAIVEEQVEGGSILRLLLR